MSSTGGGIVVHPSETKQLTGHGKTINLTNNGTADLDLSNEAVHWLTTILPNNASITIPG